MAEALMADLLSDFTQNNLDWLRRTATARHASLSAEEFSQLAIVCEVLADLAHRYLDLTRTVLDRGVEAGTLKVRLERSITYLSNIIQTMAELQQVGETASDNIESDLDRIRNASAKTKAVHAELASLLALAKSESPPVPEDLLTAAEAGPFIRLDEFRKRR